MRAFRALRGVGVAACTAVCVLGPTAGSAFASSGELTSAVANPTWTKGSVTGSVTWDGCAKEAPGHCEWLPLVKAQTTLENCSAETALDENSTIRTFWNRGGQSADGTIPISEPNGLLLQGVYGQRACLVVIYSHWYVEPICVIQYETIRQFNEENHLPPPTKSLAESCPPEKHIQATLLASRLFLVETPQPPTQETLPSQTTTAPTTNAPPGITGFASNGAVKLSSGTGTITAGCIAATNETCTVSLTLIASVKGGHASSTKHVTVGTVTGTVPGGRSGKLKVKLTSRGRGYLKHGTLHLEAKGTVKNTAGLVTKISRRLTIKKR